MNPNRTPVPAAHLRQHCQDKTQWKLNKEFPLVHVAAAAVPTKGHETCHREW